MFDRIDEKKKVKDGLYALWEEGLKSKEEHWIRQFKSQPFFYPCQLAYILLHFFIYFMAYLDFLSRSDQTRFMPPLPSCSQFQKGQKMRKTPIPNQST